MFTESETELAPDKIITTVASSCLVKFTTRHHQLPSGTSSHGHSDSLFRLSDETSIDFYIDLSDKQGQ